MSRMSTLVFIHEKLQGSPRPPTISTLNLDYLSDEFDVDEEFNVRKNACSEVDQGNGLDFSDISDDDLANLMELKSPLGIRDFLLKQGYSERVCRAALNVYYPHLKQNTSDSNVDPEPDAATDETIRHSSVIFTDSSLDDIDLSGFIPVDISGESTR